MMVHFHVFVRNSWCVKLTLWDARSTRYFVESRQKKVHGALRFNWPGKRVQDVPQLIETDTRWSTDVGVVNFSERKQISYNASLSNNMPSSQFSES